MRRTNQFDERIYRPMTDEEARLYPADSIVATDPTTARIHIEDDGYEELFPLIYSGRHSVP